ncbi:G/U mismatch-specific uracil-DNA glycosylase [Methanococcoides vulcani]|uniref:G/U mismatch-specific uracil-DNA glycosylase n=1 Tax=Methanococcoides vulcani TaxID=1353158 RepID=A0A1I0A9T0_9EURY|nr:DNA-deoxyinosine glycosylase [Methanococcoides vulcani]SES90908.1 G/U mismatch-specific uracil-DNA glycosylase [Methanococcoides vulcani]
MEPIIDENTTLLIVGTFPSQISRDIGQYYGNPRNQFWKLLGSILDINLQELEYNGRIRVLQEHKIGLWDTVKSCQIKGSSDQSIRNEEYNDFSHLTNIKKIICNGSKAMKFIKHCNVPDGVSISSVPSSSPARAIKFSEKLKEWGEEIVI